MRKLTPTICAFSVAFGSTSSGMATFIDQGTLLKDIDVEELPLVDKTVENVSRKYRLLGDMLIPQEEIRGRVFSGKLWSDGKIVFQFASNVSPDNRKDFLRACAAWEKGTKIKCTERNGQSNYVIVSSASLDSGVAGQSVVGMPNGAGHMDISDWSYKTLVHEIGHMIGKAHEHQRSDAASYLDIHLENTNGSNSVKFNLIPLVTRNHNKIDFYSCMFYWTDAFSSSGQPTIVLKPDYRAYQDKIGQGQDPSKTDLEDVNVEYK